MDYFTCTSGVGDKSKGESKGQLLWWQLSLIGIGCTIGTGYFLGSGIGIKITGPSMVFSFVLAALGTYIVFHFLAKMTQCLHITWHFSPMYLMEQSSLLVFQP
jgi:L-asparagine transporter-like permease